MVSNEQRNNIFTRFFVGKNVIRIQEHFKSLFVDRELFLHKQMFCVKEGIRDKLLPHNNYLFSS